MEKSQASKWEWKRLTSFFSFFSFSVQDFLDKAKKEFEENWSKNPKVSEEKDPGKQQGSSTTSYTYKRKRLLLLRL